MRMRPAKQIRQKVRQTKWRRKMQAKRMHLVKKRKMSSETFFEGSPKGESPDSSRDEPSLTKSDSPQKEGEHQAILHKQNQETGFSFQRKRNTTITNGSF
jgi:hypothetical protein